MLRITTNSVLKSYRLQLTNSYSNLQSASNTVLTQRSFNSYSEDPATASEAFTLRRSFLRTSAQSFVSEAVISQYEVGWSTMESVINTVSSEQSTSAYGAVMRALNDSTGSGRTALGNSLLNIAENLVQSMNVQYGDSYVFSGSDGLTLPFSWNDDGKLCYQGIPVDTPDCTNLSVGDEFPVGSGKTITQDDIDNWNALQKASKQTRYVDIGLGMQEDENGNLITSSAFDASMPGINYLGYGVDDDGEPNNIVSALYRMGTILRNCDSEGNWASAEEQQEITRLFNKLGGLVSNISEMHVEMDTRATFLKNNQAQLENVAYTLNEQIVDLESIDLADAITSYSWAQYCYNAALRVGNSILSNTLIDYMT